MWHEGHEDRMGEVRMRTGPNAPTTRTDEGRREKR